VADKYRKIFNIFNYQGIAKKNSIEISCHHVSMTIFKKLKTNTGENKHMMFVGMYISPTTEETNMEVPQKTS
jgi:hypothetical protein